MVNTAMIKPRNRDALRAWLGMGKRSEDAEARHQVGVDTVELSRSIASVGGPPATGRHVLGGGDGPPRDR